MADQYEMQNPLTQYPATEYPKQRQPAPGVQADMQPRPDCGENSYRGSDRLKRAQSAGDRGRLRHRARGGDCLCPRRADVALSYLPAEQKDAEEVAKLVEQAGRKAFLLPGDVSQEAFSKKLVEDAREHLGGLDILALVAGKQVAVEDIADLTTEQFRKTYETNVFSLYWITQAAIPHMPPGAALSPRPPFRPISPARTCWTMPRRKPLSLPTRAGWRSRSSIKASA